MPITLYMVKFRNYSTLVLLMILMEAPFWASHKYCRSIIRVATSKSRNQRYECLLAFPGSLLHV